MYDISDKTLVLLAMMQNPDEIAPLLEKIIWSEVNKIAGEIRKKHGSCPCIDDVIATIQTSKPS